MGNSGLGSRVKSDERVQACTFREKAWPVQELKDTSVAEAHWMEGRGIRGKTGEKDQITQSAMGHC